MIYLDASTLVALLVEEQHSAAAVGWMRSRRPEDLFASDWTATEVGSALAFKLRLGQIDAEHHREAVLAAAQVFAGVEMIPVEPHHFAAAGKRHVMAPPVGLRAGDALHLALILDHGLALATLDRKLADAARKAGVAVEPILPD